MKYATSTLGPPKSVDVSRIESELTELWRDSALKEQEKSGAAIMRACAQNVIAIVADTEGADMAEEIFGRLTAEHPSRGIIAIVEADESNRGLDAWISARCQLPTPEGKQLCCEQIVISARGHEAANDVAPTILSLFIPDLPTFVWWRDRSPFDMPGADHILEIVDRVVVNSANFPDPHQGLKQLLAIVQDPHYACALGDFDWERLIHWRSMIAQFFDIAATRPYLDRIDRVLLEYAAAEPATAWLPVRPLLLAGWLASRLGWDLARADSGIEGGRGEWRFHANDRQVAVTIAPTVLPDDIEGRLISATLSVGGEAPAEFSVRRSDDRRYLETASQVAGATSANRLMHPDQAVEADLLARQLKLLSHDRVYEQALEVACRLIEDER